MEQLGSEVTYLKSDCLEDVARSRETWWLGSFEAGGPLKLGEVRTRLPRETDDLALARPIAAFALPG